MKKLYIPFLISLSFNAVANDNLTKSNDDITLEKSTNNHHFIIKNENDDSKNYTLNLGIGSFTFDSIYKGGKTRSEVVPYLSYQYKSFFIDGESMGLNFNISDNWSFSTLISNDFITDNDRGDSRQLADMHKIDDTTNAGLGFAYKNNFGKISLNINKDISNNHKGTSATLLFSSPINLGKWVVIPEIGTSWFSSDVSQYYYGVQEDEVLSGRAFYQPKSGFNYNLGATFVRPLSEHHNIALSIFHERFSSEISDSPIVDRKNLSNVGLFYIYNF